MSLQQFRNKLNDKEHMDNTRNMFNIYWEHFQFEIINIKETSYKEDCLENTIIKYHNIKKTTGRHYKKHLKYI